MSLTGDDYVVMIYFDEEVIIPENFKDSIEISFDNALQTPDWTMKTYDV